MDDDRDKQPASAPEKSNDVSDAEKVSADDRHKTEKLARHEGVDPNTGQE